MRGGGFHAQGVRDGDGVLLRAYNHRCSAGVAGPPAVRRARPAAEPQPLVPLLAELLPSLGLRHALKRRRPSVALNSLALRAGDGVHAVAWREDRIASMTLTSGSMGLPKRRCTLLRPSCQRRRRAGDDTLCAAGRLAAVAAAVFTFPARDSLALAVSWRRPDGTRQAAAGTGVTRLYPCLSGADPALRLSGDAEVSLSGSARRGDLVALTEQAGKRGIRCWCGYGLTEFAPTVCAKEADGLADVGRSRGAKRIVDGEVWLVGQHRRRLLARWANGPPLMPTAGSPLAIGAGWSTAG